MSSPMEDMLTKNLSRYLKTQMGGGGRVGRKVIKAQR